MRGVSATAAALAERPKLFALRDEIALALSGSVSMSAPALEWSRLDDQHRIVFLMLAGVDGDMHQLQSQNWHEFAPAEQLAVQAAIRSMRRDLAGVYALVRR